MRPRISKREAKYILETLQTNKLVIEQKIKHYDELKKQVELMRLELKYGGDAYKIVIKDGLGAKREELEKLQGTAYEFYDHLRTHAVLIKKYQAMVDGNLNRSQWKTVSPLIHNWSWPTDTALTEVVSN